jgi:hypothetical protein
MENLVSGDGRKPCRPGRVRCVVSIAGKGLGAHTSVIESRFINFSRSLKMTSQIEFAAFSSNAEVTAYRVIQAHEPERQEWLLDEALGETFPASDPISPSFIR